MIDPKEITIGMKVHYKPDHYADSQFENGIVKSVQQSLFAEEDPYIFVVYHCAGEWDNFRHYTAARTNPRELYPGWK